MEERCLLRSYDSQRRQKPADPTVTRETDTGHLPVSIDIIINSQLPLGCLPGIAGESPDQGHSWLLLT